MDINGIQIQPPKDALLIIESLQANGFEAGLVGGCVRDSILGIAPKDWDISTSAPVETVKWLFPNCVLVGEQFGVVTWKDFQIATFRKDGEYTDGRRPETVEFGTIYDDLARRDFTINSIYVDPIKGIIHDYFNGQKHIEERQLVAVGNAQERINEDYLRMLRAVRFTVKYDFVMNGGLITAISNSVANLNKVSGERVRDELLEIIKYPRAFDYLTQLGILDTLFPEISVYDVAAIERIRVKDFSDPCVRLLGYIRLESFEALEVVSKRLKLSNEQYYKLMDCVINFSDVQRYFNLENWEVVELLRKKNIEDVIKYASAILQDGDIETQYQRDKWLFKPQITAQPALTGDDIKALGYEPGPMFRRVLKVCQRAQDQELIRESKMPKLAKILMETFNEL